MNKNALLNKKESKIRTVIYVFFIFEMTMLVQTSHSHLGTIITGILCVLMVFTFFLNSQYIKVNLCNCAILLYVLVLFIISVFTTGLSSRLFQLAIYASVFILLSSLNLSKREKDWIVNGFVLASVFYSILIIFYRVTNPTMYIHSRITILGSELDPNYIGLPLIVGFSILLFDTMNQKLNIFNILGLIVLAFAVLLTSSRGNFLSLSICVIGNVLHFLNNISIKLYKKTLIIVTLILVLVLFFFFVSNNYDSYLQRILNFSVEDLGNGRSELWNEAIGLWWKSPLWGNGFEALGNLVNKGAHNTYIQVLCDSGIIGFLFFSLFLGSMLKKCFRYDKCLLIGLLGLICHSFFLGAIVSRCFWVVIIMIGMALTNSKFAEE